MGNTFDFSGWATRNDLRCSDGRTIRRDAFKHNHKQTVPLVWNHQHNDANNILGHVLLENRDEGIYAYGTFNDTENGNRAKTLVQHGDVTALSIYANQLKQQGHDVIHGTIREVSLVLAGANPGAFIDAILSHSDSDEYEEAVIYTDEYISHSEIEVEEIDENEETAEEDENVENDENVKDEKVDDAVEDGIEHSDKQPEKTIQDVLNTLNEEQQLAVYGLIGEITTNKNEEDSKGGNEEMKHNAFIGNQQQDENVLAHAEGLQVIIDNAKRHGSMKESYIAHAADYGIDQIDYLFPDFKTLNKTPEFISRDMGWVSKFMSGVHRTPFSRIKSVFANITEDEARAKGYIKGKLKKEEVFTLLKRTTSATTIYKKQKMDRDDVIEITDFDVIAWLKTEMRMMLDEEIARAALVGDGRLADSEDKINEQNIRPIWKDEELYTIKALVEVATGATAEDRAKAFIKSAIKSRKNYKGSGKPAMYMTEDLLTDCLLIEDATGRCIYEDEAKLAKKLRVSEIVTVPVMEGLTREDGSGNTLGLMGIIVNLVDYNIGADKGGAVNMFDDFDIDYNQQKYLIETRCSGALTKPYSAIAIEYKVA